MPLENVTKGSGSTKGAGLKRRIYFGLVDEVETWPTENASPSTLEEVGTLSAAVAMSTGNQMYYFDATIRKSSLTSTSAGQRGSKSALNKLEIVRAAITANVIGFIKQHMNDEMFFIVNDLSGQPRFIGEEDLPAMLEEFEIPSGADVSDEVDCKITFEHAGTISLMYGTEAVPLTIPLTPAA
ncbi:MAG: hypothetical protein ACI93L_003314 [Cyclobacteriaceae bacterium]|jgi:hypothetical protein